MEFIEKEDGKVTHFEWIAADKLYLAQSSGKCSVISLAPESFAKKLVVIKAFSSPIE